MVQPLARYRIFISYSHRDEPLVRRLERVLQENGLTTMRDKDFAFGVGFPDQIKRFIEYAHVFMPVITRESSQRGWVHQEIGYAMGRNVPVLPVAIDWEPGQWLQTLHSVILNHKDLRRRRRWKLRGIFSPGLFRDLVQRHGDDRSAVYACGTLHEDRTQMMTEYAREVSGIQALLPPVSTEHAHTSGMSSFVRQKGGLSSFHIPDEPVVADVWRTRYAPDNQKSEHHCRLQRNERIALTLHARRWGCRLIVNPRMQYKTEEMTVVRLRSLLQFLESADGQKVEVAFNEQMLDGEHRTIVGNWFLADTVAAVPRSGYYQTIFTRHAPSMEFKIEEFDDEFHRLLQQSGWDPHNSRVRAITDLRGRLEGLEAGLRPRGEK